MDIERLTKVQIVLLTLLVSFVTSIATGIVTVSLMDQAPPSIAQTVNRIVERTVQTVVPAAQTGSAATTQTTVVVKESDLIAQAVGKVTPSIVRLFTLNEESPTFLGLGIVLDSAGTIVTDTSAIGQGAEMVVALSDGTRVRASVASRDESLGVAFLAATTTAEKNPTWTPIKISDANPTLGQSILTLSGNTVARIADGIIEAITPATDEAPQVIETSISESAIMYGSPLIDTNGMLIGVSTAASRASDETGFVPVSVLFPKAEGGSTEG